MKWARIKEGASKIFWEKVLKTFRRPELIPPSYREFKNKLEKLEGKVLEVEKEYDDRVVLKYPPEFIEKLPEGGIVSAIDVEKDLVELEKGLGER
jgi:hypothetical protein